MSSISRKTVAWASGAALVVGGTTAGIVLATQGGQSASGHTAGGTAAAAKPLRVVSISPASGTKDVNGAGTVTVTYNQKLPASAALPTLSPAIAGSWQRVGDTAVFTPGTGYAQRTEVTVTVAGTAGGAAGSAIGGKPASAAASASASAPAAAAPPAAAASAAATASPGASSPVKASAASADALASATFTTGSYSPLREQQILAQLGYLPLSWTPDAGASTPAATAAAQQSAAYQPPAGSFSWESGYPSQMKDFWAEGKANTMARGALMGFEADHNLTVDGKASTKVWNDLLTAAVKDQQNAHGYSYAVASKGQPERLTIWHDGKKVFSSLANTGIGVAPTVDGTFPVFEKLPFQIMSGTNPDGSHYADPVQWVSYFNGGDAVHYFPRGSYGWPQSLGCVELPYSTAKSAYSVLPYGTLVTVA